MGFCELFSNSVKKFIKSVNFTFGHSQMVLVINSVARGLLKVIFKISKKFIKSVNFTFGQSQVVLEINSIARGLLRVNFIVGKRIYQIRKFHFWPLAGGLGN